MISCTSRTKVRSISDADINCAFSRRFAWRFDVRGDMNAASYACRAGRSKVALSLPGCDAELGEYHYVPCRVFDADFFCAVERGANRHRNINSF